jgi:hypothetical protein
VLPIIGPIEDSLLAATIAAAMAQLDSRS